MTFEEFQEINEKYGTSRMWTDGLENISKEDYEEYTRRLVEVFEDLFARVIVEEEDDF